MKRTVLSLTIFGLLAAGTTWAQQPTSTAQQGRLTDQVRHGLVMLPFYSVFDHMQFQVVGRQVVLMGQVSRPTLKTDAERTVKRIEGVDTVVNRIEVLPLSNHDDQIRLAVYRALYGHRTLNLYALRSVPPIHIIVKHGDVTLEGAVSSEADKTMARILANTVSGVFSVTDNLRVDHT